MVCPSSLVMNWANEFDKFVGKASQPKRIVIRKGGEEGVQRIKSFAPSKANRSEGMSYLISCPDYYHGIFFCITDAGYLRSIDYFL